MTRVIMPWLAPILVLLSLSASVGSVRFAATPTVLTDSDIAGPIQ